MFSFNAMPAGRRMLGASFLCLALLGLAACKGGGADGKDAKAKAEAPVEAVPVEVEAASRRSIAASYSGTASLEALAESQVVAKTSGVALAVLVEEGQAVSAGQVLVRIDPDRARLLLAQSNAQLRKLEANYRRAEQLAAQQLVSASDLDQLRYDLENVRATNRLASLELSYTNVTAPISGVIASRSIKTGNFVQINTPIFRIVDTRRLEATLNVPERELATLKPGLPVRLQADALPGREFTGTVDRVAPVVDAGSGTFRVIVAFDAQGELQPGMFGRINIAYDERANALVVPRIAVLDDQAEPAVYVVREGKAVRTPVELGYLDGSYVEVRSGIAEGDQVVTAGRMALRDGSAVKLVTGETAAGGDKPAAAKTDAKDAASGEGAN